MSKLERKALGSIEDETFILNEFFLKLNKPFSHACTYVIIQFILDGHNINTFNLNILIGIVDNKLIFTNCVMHWKPNTVGWRKTKWTVLSQKQNNIWNIYHCQIIPLTKMSKCCSSPIHISIVLLTKNDIRHFNFFQISSKFNNWNFLST